MAALRCDLQVPNTPETVFRIASLTKAFTAVAIMQLQEQGKLKVSDAVCGYLRDCPDSWRPITLVDLGYDLFDGRKLDEAVAIFEFNLAMYPGSAYSYDGLADVAVERDDRTKAVAYFEKSLSLDSTNDYASAGLERLRQRIR